MLAGCLLAVGGNKTSKGGAANKDVYMYSSSTNSWTYISDLPAPRSRAAVAVLSSIEVLVIGGWDEGKRVNTVYMGDDLNQHLAIVKAQLAHSVVNGTG